MTARRLSLTPWVLLALALTGMWSAAASPAEFAFERVLAKSNNVAPPPYRAFRRLEGGVSDSDSKRGWLEAWTQYQPGRGFTFEVVREGGSEYVRNKILRRILTSEQNLIATGKRLRASLDAKNYAFEDGGTTDEGLQRILLKPVKKSDGLVSGTLFFEPAAAVVTRIEGRLVKSPSFWLRDVDVTWKFAHAGGHVVPVEMTSSGRVRMFGRSSFKMIYDYVSIDGHPAGNGLKAALPDQH